MNVQKILLLVGVLLLPGCAGPDTVVIAVRHAEKQSIGDDPALSEAGQQRAEALRLRLAAADVAAVYSTDYARTRQTAEPLAAFVGVPVEIYSTPEEIAATVVTVHRGQTVLVVGHSNTIAPIVTAFGAAPPDELPPQIADDDYDNLVTIFINARGEAGAVHGTYGVPSP